MSDPIHPTTAPAWRHILVPTDLSDEATAPFAHAVRLAAAGGGTVTALHAAADGIAPNWSALPSARSLLVDWGMVEQDGGLEAYERLGMHVYMRSASGTGPVSAVAGEAERELPELLILGTEGRAGLNRWFSGSVAETMARAVPVPALFLPTHSAGVIDLATGEPRLHHVVMPLPDRETQREVLLALQKLASALGVERLQVTFMHVGTRDELGSLNLSSWPRWSFGTELRSGDVVEQVIAVAEELRADLIVMGTKGHDSVGDMLRGSTTERVVRHASCPVLAVPVR